MLTTIGITLGVLVAALLIYAATRPDTFRLQRSITIKAPSEKIFPFINDFKNWVAWSPYEKLDPNLKRTYGGAAQGRGAVYEWDGNNQVGQGCMEIVQSSPPSQVVIKLDFIKPFEAHNTAEFSLDGAGGPTTVTWAMYGPQPYMAKLMNVLGMTERMVGRHFETGLNNLKAIAEK